MTDKNKNIYVIGISYVVHIVSQITLNKTYSKMTLNVLICKSAKFYIKTPYKPINHNRIMLFKNMLDEMQ